MENKGLVKGERKPKYSALDARFGESLSKYFREVTEMQLKDPELWRLFVRQFRLKADDRDEGWRGEYWGKLMRGGCMVYECTHDEELYSVLREAVVMLLDEAEPDGRIATYSREKELGMWDMWVRKYVMLGLEHFWEICPERELRDRVLAALEAHARAIMRLVGEGGGRRPVLSAGFDKIGGLNALSIIQPYVRLYRLTGNRDYMDYANELISTQFCENGIFALAEADEVPPSEYPFTKAYEMTSCFEGLLECYEAGGDERYLAIAEKFARKLLATDFTVIGGSGCRDEFFDGSTKTQVVYSEINKQETCVTVTIIKFLAALWRHTGDPALIDAIERAFFNLYLGAFNDEPDRGRLPRPVFYSYSPVLRNPRWTLMGGRKDLTNYAAYGCCVAIGAAGFGTVPKVAVVKAEGEIVLNMFFDGEYSAGKTEFSVIGNYPNEGKIAVRFRAASGETLRVRRPCWATSVGAVKNGKNAIWVTKNGYIDLGTVAKNDEFIMDFGMQMKCVRSETVNAEVSDLVAFERGPIVYCAAEPDADIDRAYDFAFGPSGEPIARKLGEGKYSFALTDGGEITLLAYRTAGRDFYHPKRLTVWIQTPKR